MRVSLWASEGAEGRVRMSQFHTEHAGSEICVRWARRRRSPKSCRSTRARKGRKLENTVIAKGKALCMATSSQTGSPRDTCKFRNSPEQFHNRRPCIVLSRRFCDGLRKLSEPVYKLCKQVLRVLSMLSHANESQTTLQPYGLHLLAALRFWLLEVVEPVCQCMI